MCTDKDCIKKQTPWSFYMEKIDISPGFVPLLDCNLQI